MKIQSKVRSNAFFLIPLVIALYHQLWIYAGIILLVTIVSTIFHLSNEKKFGIVDKVLAYALILTNLYICYLANFKEPYFVIAIIFVIIGLYFLYKIKRDDRERHGASAIITLLCILGYVL